MVLALLISRWMLLDTSTTYTVMLATCAGGRVRKRGTER